ncbi:hypothetical protein [Streptosporangium sp. CA-115845]|uniref:hypothetical protein n=1 Tax=Streptosporangium sp. CA-115845 TaxID=3240071 RepID=UPI003D90A69D
MDSVVRRSCLSVPASEAFTLGADEIVIDLEDSVTPDVKPRAHTVCAAPARAERDGSGAVAVDGEMVDPAVVLVGRRTLSRAGVGGSR